MRLNDALRLQGSYPHHIWQGQPLLEAMRLKAMRFDLQPLVRVALTGFGKGSSLASPTLARPTRPANSSATTKK